MPLSYSTGHPHYCKMLLLHQYLICTSQKIICIQIKFEIVGFYREAKIRETNKLTQGNGPMTTLAEENLSTTALSLQSCLQPFFPQSFESRLQCWRILAQGLIALWLPYCFHQAKEMRTELGGGLFLSLMKTSLQFHMHCRPLHYL